MDEHEVVEKACHGEKGGGEAHCKSHLLKGGVTKRTEICNNMFMFVEENTSYITVH